MAHFAQIDTNKVVQQVIVIDNSDLLDENGVEVESFGIAKCREIFGEDTDWVQTSYNGSFRANYADIGGTYDDVNDVFIPYKHLDSWVLDTETYQWEPPVPMPNEDEIWVWDEASHVEGTDSGWIKVDPDDYPE
jgi:hypothetical protein